MALARKNGVCDRSKIRFERRRRIEIPGASGQLRCGSDVRIERHQSAFTAAGWLHLFNLCATAAILQISFLFNGLPEKRTVEFRATDAA
jgi:hypothetical protein